MKIFFKSINFHRQHFCCHSCEKIFILLCWLTLFLTSCEQNRFSDLKKYIETTRQEKIAHFKKDIFVSIKAHPANYQVSARTPFGAKGGLTPNKMNVNINPLQAYPLSMLRFVGTVTIGKITTGYVKSPDNMVYQVKVGDLLGDNHGQVKNIYSDRIDVLEKQKQANNTEKEQVVTLQLKDQH